MVGTWCTHFPLLIFSMISWVWKSTENDASVPLQSDSSPAAIGNRSTWTIKPIEQRYSPTVHDSKREGTEFGYHGQSKRCGRNHLRLHFLCDSRECSTQLERTLSHSITGEGQNQNTDGCKHQVMIQRRVPEREGYYVFATTFGRCLLVLATILALKLSDSAMPSLS